MKKRNVRWTNRTEKTRQSRKRSYRILNSCI